jgi:hypothetical protein
MKARLVPVMGERGRHGVWPVAQAFGSGMDLLAAGFGDGRVVFNASDTAALVTPTSCAMSFIVTLGPGEVVSSRRTRLRSSGLLTNDELGGSLIAQTRTRSEPKPQPSFKTTGRVFPSRQ